MSDRRASLRSLTLPARQTVRLSLALPVYPFRRLADADAAAELLERVGLDHSLGERYPRELSGGQRQRVGVARALAADPPLLLMDEPFGALDPITRAELQREFLALQGRLHKTVVFVTHDLREALLLGTRIALMEDGRLISVNTPQEFVDSTEPMVAAYVAAFGTPEIRKRANP